MSNKQDRVKQQVARAALDYILPQLDAQSVIGIGTGSTTDFFIDALTHYKNQFRAAVASSERSASRLQQHQIAVLELNEVQSLPFYIDGADAIDAALNMIKGGGGALTREKIDRKSTRLNSSHVANSYAVFCLKKKKNNKKI